MNSVYALVISKIFTIVLQSVSNCVTPSAMRTKWFLNNSAIDCLSLITTPFSLRVPFQQQNFCWRFFTRPTATETPRFCSALVFIRETSPGARSTRNIALGQSKGCRPMTSWESASRRASVFSSGTMHDAAKEVVHSFRRTMSWRQRLMASAANDTPTTSGGSFDDWLVTVPFTFKKVPLKISSFLFLNHANLLHPKPFSILLGSYVSFNSKITFVQLPLSFEKKRGKERGLGGCAQAIPRLLNASTRGTSTFDLVLTNLQN